MQWLSEILWGAIVCFMAAFMIWLAWVMTIEVFFPARARRRAERATPPGWGRIAWLFLGGLTLIFLSGLGLWLQSIPECPGPYRAENCDPNPDWMLKFGPLFWVTVGAGFIIYALRAAFGKRA